MELFCLSSSIVRRIQCARAVFGYNAGAPRNFWANPLKGPDTSMLCTIPRHEIKNRLKRLGERLDGGVWYGHREREQSKQ